MVNTLLELKNVSMHFGGLKAVDNVSFAVNEGEILSLIGPNGAGKQLYLMLSQGFISQLLVRSF